MYLCILIKNYVRENTFITCTFGFNTRKVISVSFSFHSEYIELRLEDSAELQSFPLKGKPVYFKIYRYRWKESGGNRPHSHQYDLHIAGIKNQPFIAQKFVYKEPKAINGESLFELLARIGIYYTNTLIA